MSTTLNPVHPVNPVNTDHSESLSSERVTFGSAATALPTMAEHEESLAAADGVRSAQPVGGGLFYGWIMVPLAMLALAASSPGQTYGVTIFNESIRTDLRLDHGAFALAYTLGTIFGAFPITLFGWSMDRFGIRATMLAMIGLFSMACLFMSLATGWVLLMFGFMFLRMLGPGALAFVSGNTLAYWFERRLGMVEGIRSLGTALAMAFTPMISLYLMHRFGWRGAYVCFAIFMAAVLLPLFWKFYRNRPGDLGQYIDGHSLQRIEADRNARQGQPHSPDFTLGQALRTPAFWIISGGTATYGLVQTALFFSLVPIFAERGLTATDAATMLSVFGVALTLMQFIGGMLADRFSSRHLMAAGLTLFSCGLGLITFGGTGLSPIVIGLIFGTSQGLFMGAAHPVWARYFGREHLGKIRGCLMTINVASSSLGPLFAGVTYDLFGHFGFAMIVFTFAPLPLAALSLAAHKPMLNPESCPESAADASGNSQSLELTNPVAGPHARPAHAPHPDSPTLAPEPV